MNNISPIGNNLETTFWQCIREDARLIINRSEKKPLIYHIIRMLLFYPGFQLMLSIRIQRLVARVPLFGKVMQRILWYISTIYFSCEVDTGSKLGPGIYIPHPFGIIIGDGVQIDGNVTILQGVTLGRRTTEEKSVMRICSGTSVNAGAKIIGNITIGHNCQIGANAVVLVDVPDNYTAVGVPARLLPPKNHITSHSATATKN